MTRKHYNRIALITLGVLILLSSFYTLPYYVSKPGTAKELAPIIKVEGGDSEEGSFMLTTVAMGQANIYTYLLAKWNKYQEIYPIGAIRAEDETDQEYKVRQLYYMTTSKLSAIEVAYRKANLPVEYDYQGVYVLSVTEGMPADGVLEPGDRIFMVDKREFQSSDEFITYVSDKKAGDEIELTYKRGDKVSEVTLTLQAFSEDETKIGVGIGLVDEKEMIVEPKVTLETSDIGGPSAGLMFSLEIYNQLVAEDLTRGKKIAGTGTLDSNGTVGRIGGIEQKVIAADKAGAQIFLAPNENGAKGSNYQEAVETAKAIKTKMKIIPVDTFDDAVAYLTSLKE